MSRCMRSNWQQMEIHRLEVSMSARQMMVFIGWFAQFSAALMMRAAGMAMLRVVLPWPEQVPGG
jgi:hypothetical protein